MENAPPPNGSTPPADEPTIPADEAAPATPSAELPPSAAPAEQPTTAAEPAAPSPVAPAPPPPPPAIPAPPTPGAGSPAWPGAPTGEPSWAGQPTGQAQFGQPASGQQPSADNPSGYPVRVTFDRNQSINRLWGIPLLGVVVRAILCIPHFIVLSLWAIGIVFVYLVIWIPILLMGRYPGWAYGFVGGFARWWLRVVAYIVLMTADYPPFSTARGYAVELDFDENQRLNRAWGIPGFGLWFRMLLAIPHFIVLWLFGILVGVLSLITWIPVLLFGHYPSWGYDFVGGFYRWYARVGAYIGFLASPYPPFSKD